MRTITREWLQKAINQHESMRDEIPFGLDEDDSNTLAALRIALASLEAEPVVSHIGSKNALDAIVAFIKSNRNPTLKDHNEVSSRLFQDNCHGLSNHVIEYIKQIGDELEELRSTQDTDPPAPATINAEPVTTAYKLPDDFDFDRFNDVVWLEAVASNPHMHSLTTSTIAMVALELNKRLNVANSPVIPDGWVMVPVEPTMEMLSAAKKWTGLTSTAEVVYREMLAASPRQEVKP